MIRLTAMRSPPAASVERSEAPPPRRPWAIEVKVAPILGFVNLPMLYSISDALSTVPPTTVELCELPHPNSTTSTCSPTHPPTHPSVHPTHLPPRPSAYLLIRTSTLPPRPRIAPTASPPPRLAPH